MSYTDLQRPPYDQAALRAALLDNQQVWSDLSVTDNTGSTNADAAAAARAGAAEGAVFVADQQNAGRGRLDRAWTAPPASGVIVSVVLRPDNVPAAKWVWLPLLTGLAVDATVQQCGVDSQVKWPNDVLVDGRKIAGILLERVETPTGPAAIVGVGLNTTLRTEELPVPTATSLLLEGASTSDRTLVLRAFLRNLDALYRSWRDHDGDAEAGLRASYERRCVTVGQHVRVTLPHAEPLLGQATGIDDHGRLLVDGQAISAGDITHVRPAT
jgi:BirA family biotin operon repressor/biotin-[acetyl-CoA-carboxylase] ligase